MVEDEHNKYKGILKNVNSFHTTSNTVKTANTLKRSRKLSKIND